MRSTAIAAASSSMRRASRASVVVLLLPSMCDLDLRVGRRRKAAVRRQCRGRRYPWRMAKVIEKRPDGTTVIVVPAVDASELEVGAAVDVLPRSPGSAQDQPWPVGALAGKLPPIEIADIKAARQEALRGKTG